MFIINNNTSLLFHIESLDKWKKFPQHYVLVISTMLSVKNRRFEPFPVRWDHQHQIMRSFQNCLQIISLTILPSELLVTSKM